MGNEFDMGEADVTSAILPTRMPITQHWHPGAQLPWASQTSELSSGDDRVSRPQGHPGAHLPWASQTSEVSTADDIPRSQGHPGAHFPWASQTLELSSADDSVPRTQGQPLQH